MKNKKKKIIKKKAATKVIKKSNGLSISQITFKFITDKKVLESDNKKALLSKLIEIIKQSHPASKFNSNHYYWYINKYKQQKKYKLALTHLQTSKLEAIKNK